jgi:hypothetical protein
VTIEVTGPDRSIVEFPEGTPTSTMQTALAKAYGGPQTAGSALAQLSDPEAPQPPSAGDQTAPPAPQSQPDPAADAAPDLALASLPPGGGFAQFADAARDAAEPWLDALAADPSPVWNARLGLFSQTKPMRDAAGVVAGALQDGGVSPALAGLVADPLTGGWRPPESLDEAGGRPPSAATWLGLYHTLPGLLRTDPWTGQALPDADSPENANIASIAGHLRKGFIGDPLTGAGGAIPGYGQVHALIGDPFSIRAAHDGMEGTLFAGDPSGFNGAWLKAQTPAEQAAARAAVTSEIQDRIESGQILPGQLGAPDAQARLATMFGPGQAQAIAAKGEAAINARLASLRDEDAPGQAGFSSSWLDDGVAPGAGFTGDDSSGRLMSANFTTPAPDGAPGLAMMNHGAPIAAAGSSSVGNKASPTVGPTSGIAGVLASLALSGSKHPIPTALGPNNYEPRPGDENLLARMIFAETGDIPKDSAAIGWSIMNRAGARGRTLTDIMYQPRQFAFAPGGGEGPKGSAKWQQSANPATLKPADAASWAAAKQVAAGIFNGDITDPTGGSDGYFSSRTYNGNPRTAEGDFPTRLNQGRIVPSPYRSQSAIVKKNYFFIAKIKNK